MILGLTGGMGCGKSTAARIFEQLGYARIDSDKIVREEVLLHPEIRNAVREKLGNGVITTDGLIDRAAVAKVVFYDNAMLQWLEDLVHPRLYEIWRTQLATNPGGRWVIEVPLLFEKSLQNWFDFTVCVTSSSACQLARLTERGIPKALAEQRISKQLPLARKMELSDFVLSNDGSLDFLHDQIVRLIARLDASK